MKPSRRNLAKPAKAKEPGGKPKHSKYALKMRPHLVGPQNLTLPVGYAERLLMREESQ